MTYHWTIPLIAALSILSLGIIVNRFGPKTRLGEAFTFLSVTLVFWNLNFVVQYAITNRDLAFEIVRVLRVGSMFVPPAVFHLSIALRDRRSKLLEGLLIADYVGACVLTALNAADLIVSDLHKFTWGYYSVGAPFYHFYTIFVLINFLGAGGLMVQDFITSRDPRMRLQLKFWLLGLIVALPLGITNLLPAYGIAFYPLGNLGSAVWAGIVAYAIVRHRLMDIEVVVAKGIAYAGAALLVFGPAVGLLAVLERWAFGEVHYDFSAAMVVMLIAVAIMFPFFRVRVEVALGRALFREKYTRQAVLTQFAMSIVRILDRDRLFRELCDTLNNVFGLDRTALFVRDDAAPRFELQRVVGALPSTENFSIEDPFVRFLGARGEPVLRDEAVASATDESGQYIGGVFDDNSWEACVPLVNGRLLLGFVCLGRKRGLQAFSVGDLEILRTIGAEASIAVENARLYQQVRRSQEIINRAGRLSALGTLAAGIAHEIRNPLVSIHTFFQLAPDRLGDEEFMTSFLGLAEGEVQRITHLIGELLTFAKTSTPVIVEIDLNDIVDRAVKLLAPQARAERVDLHWEAGAPTTRVRADPEQLVQVLVNIVLNAIQATPRGGAVRVAMREIHQDGTRYCQVEIRDTGPGIPGDLREAIFDPFFTTKDKGTGLGLAVAHRIVSDFGGFINVDSVEGQGARFFVNLPVARGDTASEVVDSRVAGLRG